MFPKIKVQFGGRTQEIDFDEEKTLILTSRDGWAYHKTGEPTPTWGQILRVQKGMTTFFLNLDGRGESVTLDLNAPVPHIN